MRIPSYLIILLFLLLTPTIPANAETVTARVPLTSGAEVSPPVPVPATGTGMATVTFNITRDASGTITAATANFFVTINIPENVTIVGLHIHEGAATANGPVVINTGLTSLPGINFIDGEGVIDVNAPTVDLAVLGRLVANPAGFYVNVHTTANPAGAIRGQLTGLVETLARTVPLTTAAEISPPVPVPAGASGTATITLNPARNTKGEITGGTVNFAITYDFPAGVTIVGLHIHEGAADANGPVVINTGVSAGSPVISADGKGTLSIPVQLTTTTTIGALQRLIANPANFYINLHTTVNTAGAIRGQLSALQSPPVIYLASNYLLMNGSESTIRIAGFGFNANSQALVNGQVVTTTYEEATNELTASIPASLLPNPFWNLNSPVLYFLQIKNTAGQLSSPVVVVAIVTASVNPINMVTVDAARYGNTLAAQSIAVSFGTKLASTTVSGPAFPPPALTLDGTTVYVNGMAAPLFYVSPGQINLQIPPNVIQGTGSVVTVAKDGTVSRGSANIGNIAPAIFTRKGDGTGAPAATASKNGQVFDILVANNDGTPVALDAGNYVSLYGTGFRFLSGPATITLGGTNIIPLFVGPQGQFAGLDQINFQIPLSLAGKGDADLVITLDAKTSNLVKMKIK